MDKTEIKRQKAERRRLALAQILQNQCNGKIAELALKIGCSDSYAARMLYEEGKLGKKNIGEDMAEQIVRAFNLELGALDVVAATTTIPSPNKSSSTEIEIPQYIKVRGSMGNGVLLRDQPGEIHGWRVTPEWLLKNVPSNTGIENLAIVTGFGPSMRGMFNPGDPLLVDRGVKKVEHDAVYFFRVGDEGFIKTLQRVPGVGLRAISKNKEFETWTITPDMDFEVLAKVLKVWQSEDF